MAAEYLENNYDRVRRMSIRPCERIAQKRLAVLFCLLFFGSIRELRHETTVAQAFRGNPAGSGKFYRHDSIHCKRG